MSEFNAGDRVYLPYLGTKVFTLDKHNGKYYSLTLKSNEKYMVTSYGTCHTFDKLPRIFHATERNRELLSELYGIEFDYPPATGSNLARELLKKGKSIICAINNKSEKDALCYDVTFALIERYDEERECFYDVNNINWKYAVPVTRYGELVKDESI